MNTQTELAQSPAHPTMEPNNDGLELGDVFSILLKHWHLILGGSVGVGLATFGLTFLIPPTYTAKTVILPPQQQQSIASVALSSLGALGALAGGVTGLKSPGDQYAGLLQSQTVSDHIIDKYDLINIYDSDFRIDATKELATNVRISISKKDGLLSIEVDDKDATRSAAIANSYVEELRTLTTSLAITEAQQRRNFFEQHLVKAKENLAQAQIALQTSGFTASALKTEPKAAAETYARLRAEITAGEVKLQALRGTLVDRAPEIVQQSAILSELHRQLARIETNTSPSNDADYTSRYREFKYQETLFEMFARQYELARIDESREGTLIQILDPATPPERKSKPKQGVIAIMAACAAALMMSLLVVTKNSNRLKTTPSA